MSFPFDILQVAASRIIERMTPVRHEMREPRWLTAGIYPKSARLVDVSRGAWGTVGCRHLSEPIEVGGQDACR